MLAIILTVLCGTVMMFWGLGNRQNLRRPAVVMATILLVLTAYMFGGGNDLQITGMYDFYEFTRERYFILLILTAGFLLYLLLMGRSLDEIGRHDGEVYALLFFAMCGLAQLVMYKHLLTLFLGIETMSIPLYVLAGSDKENIKSNEASLKYFLLGAFTTGILLLGITLLYGATGSFDLNATKVYFSDFTGNSLALIGVGLILIGFAFKSSLVPFHIWTPDVYDGSPTPVTAFMSTIVKAGVVYALYVFVTHATGIDYGHWQIILSILAAATLLVGNLSAVYQQSTKRMLAYSSIGQAGFMILPILALNGASVSHLSLYFIAYIAASLGIFTVLNSLRDYTYDGFLGLSKTQPILAVATTIFLISLAGLPISGGFFAKLFAIMHTLQYPNLIWLSIVALLMAAVGVYYYLQPIWAMYFRRGAASETEPLSNTQVLVLILLVLVIVVLGVMPEIFTRYLVL